MDDLTFSRLSRRRAIVNAVTLVSAAVVATAIPLRGFLSGQLLGDLGDGRWTVSVFEHWHEVFTGRESLTQMPFFFPAPNALGLSDAFLAPGVLHALLRLAGVGLIPAWSLAVSVGFLVGNLGLAFLSRQVFSRLITQAAFVLVAGTTYPFVTQMGHVQTLGYGMVWWVIALSLWGFRNRGPGSGIAWYFVLPVVVVGALTSWYPAIFLVAIAALAGMYGLLLSRDLSWPRKVWARCRELSWRGWIISGIASVSLIALWVVVYAPYANSMGRSWNEYLNAAPRFTDIFNVFGGSGLWWDLIHQFAPDMQPSSLERSVGFTPVLAISLVVLCLALLRGSYLRSQWVRPIYVVVVMTVVTTWMVISVDENGNSLFKFLWRFIPGASTVRASARVNIVLVVIVLIVICRLIEKWVLDARFSPGKSSKIRWAVFVALLAFVFLEQQRAPQFFWRPADYVPSSLVGQVARLKASDCESYILDGSQLAETSKAFVDVDAVSLAVLSGVPTLNGYSGGAPIGYPSVPTDTPAGIAAIALWAANLGHTSTCVVTPEIIYPLTSNAKG